MCSAVKGGGKKGQVAKGKMYNEKETQDLDSENRGEAWRLGTMGQVPQWDGK